MILRAVTLDDAPLLFHWRNDADTRRASLNRDAVPWPTHLNWLQHSLHCPQRHLWLGMCQGQACGVLRGDGYRDGLLLSWTIAPAVRGRGLGKAMLTLLARGMQQPLYAEIRHDNTASQALATHMGMRRHHIHADRVLFYRPPITP